MGNKLDHAVRARLKSYPIVELRQYTLHPGKRDTLIDLFERELIEPQESAAMQVIGQFHDLDDPDRFVWLRGFPDMTTRAESLNAFYTGEVWKTYRDAANATMIDSDNVLLLRVAYRESGFVLAKPILRDRGVVVATIFYFDSMPDQATLDSIDKAVSKIATSETFPLASFVTERSPNNFPRLPVREAENVYVRFIHFAHQDGALEQTQRWKEQILEEFPRRSRLPDVLRLQPTSRSLVPGVY